MVVRLLFSRGTSMKRRKWWLLAGACAGLMVLGWLHGPPRSSSATDRQGLTDYALYAVTNPGGALVRYGFADHRLDTIGTVQLPDGTPVRDIQAAAYVPRNLNIFAFGRSPTDGLTRLLHVNALTAQASAVGQDLGENPITAAAAMKPGGVMGPVAGQPTPLSEILGWELYAIQAPTPVDFDIVQSEIVPVVPFAARVTVLGAAITPGAGGRYDMPMTVRFRVGDGTLEPFGPYDLADAGNVNDAKNPRSYVLSGTYPGGLPITITAQSWTRVSGKPTRGANVQRREDISGAADGSVTWRSNMVVRSDTVSQQVIALRNGDPIPPIEPFMNQSRIAQFLMDHVDPVTDRLVLDHNQAIYLFELGTTDVKSPAADFQDLVVLVTLAKDRFELFPGTVVPYTVNKTGQEVTFSGAAFNLGASGVHRADQFVIRVSGAQSQITVTTKANGYANTVLDAHRNEALDANGFRTRLVRTSDDHCVITVSSEGGVLALNEVTFDFGQGSQVLGPDGVYHAPRAEIEQANACDDGGASYLIRVDRRTGTFERLMRLSRAYDGLATTLSGSFFGTYKNTLYQLNPGGPYESRIGTLPTADLSALAFAGTDLFGFSRGDDQLVPVDDRTGQAGGPLWSLGIVDLGTLVFMRLPDEPRSESSD